MSQTYEVWKTAELSKAFLEGVRGAIPLAAEQIDILLRIIRKAQPNLDNFLDLGCGDGILGRSILSQYPNARGVFLDLSETMVMAAQEKVNLSSDQISFILQDFSHKDWVKLIENHAPFDVIVSGFSIHHQPDDRKKELYEEIFDLLKPGGIFLNLEHIASTTPWGEQLFDELFVDSLYAYHQQFGNNLTREEVDQKYYHRADKTANLLTSVELQCDWLREIGYQNVDCFMKLFEIALFGGMKKG